MMSSPGLEEVVLELDEDELDDDEEEEELLEELVLLPCNKLVKLVLA